MSSALTSNSWHLAKTLSKSHRADVKSLFDVQGWVCIVNGGGSGLGLVSALALAENGAKVYITGRRVELLQEAAETFSPKDGPGKIIPIQADLSTKEGVMGLVKAIEEREQFVNLLVNTHGVGGPRMDLSSTDGSAEALRDRVFEKDSVEDWAQCYNTNTTSSYFLMFGFLPLLTAAKTIGKCKEPGNIINVSSAAALRTSNRIGGFAYASSKSAVQTISVMVASEFAIRGLGVRVNVLVPGQFPSGMNNSDPEVVVDQAINPGGFRNIPWGRAGRAEEWVGALISLATNTYTTGANVVVSGAGHLAI